MLLSWIIFLPLLFAILLMCSPKASWTRPLALIFSLIEMVLSFGIFLNFDAKSPALQLVERQMWIKEFGISYFVGIDGLSLWLVILTTFLTPIVILASWTSIEKKVKGFHASLFLLESAMLGTFLAMDAILFYAFFEASLVPMYFMIGIWGYARRIYASVKFFIYTMVGSVFMLIAIIYLMLLTPEATGTMSASLLDFYKIHVPFVAGDWLNPQTLMFFAFALAFAIKVPLFPVHTWLPDAHVEAPTAGSIVLAAVMLKMGSYGFLRFAIPLFPDASANFASLMMLLAVIGIVYGALVAMVQPDMKKLVAYSSVSHMGYVILGLFAFNIYGVTGSFYQMLNHGVSTGALFILVGMIYERTHSRQIDQYGGLAAAMPLYTICFIIVTMSSIAVPMTNGFVGEFMVLLGGFEADKRFAYVAVLGVILGAAYMLWMVKKVFFGPAGPLVPQVDEGHHHDSQNSIVHPAPSKAQHDSHPLRDLNWRELVTLAPLILLIFWMGIFPGHFLSWSQASLDHFVSNRQSYQLAIYGEQQNVSLTEHPNLAPVIKEDARGH